ncbi:alpha-amylase family glycosyl hydrolase [Synechococcus sp. A10-1-5-9]|uniref:alpha-amylase family glycosyl hydrolase n=1 Tax=Synechococcus sp. A10-1-5-9 TaxID=3392295 RepID=UPI0039E73F2A
MQLQSERTLRNLLSGLYSSHLSWDLEALSSQLLQILSSASGNGDIPTKGNPWTVDDVVLITYADTVVEADQPALVSLRTFINSQLSDFAGVIHVLPFLEASSDGGFAVASHDCLESRHGDWNDLADLAEGRKLMADLVLNHVSASHPWVRQFLRDQEPGRSCVLEASPDPCWDNVVRPRSSALFTKLQGPISMRQVWTTFGPDQVDVDWSHPEVLLGFTRLLARMVAYGVRWIRLDAVGFVWKEPNTSCIHQPQAHQLVEILRQLLTIACPDGVVVTETNVPEQENLSYLRTGREAHLAYNFPLPPLLLEAAVSGSADLLNRWLSRWPSLPESTSLLNFTACHDGVGLRPLEGLMPPSRLMDLLIACEQRGGLVSHRRLADGNEVPYEINISWWSAMADGGLDPSYWQRERFLLTQLMVLALPGVPALYLPALLATANDLGRFRRTGHRRDLNRPQFKKSSVERRLQDPDSDAAAVLVALKQAIAVRATQPALHPDGQLQVLTPDRVDRVVLHRSHAGHDLVAVHNVTSTRLTLDPFGLLDLEDTDPWVDCLSGRTLEPCRRHLLNPYEVLWLVRS